MAGTIKLPRHDGPGHPPSYYAATANEIAAFDTLAGDRSCDVAIVGGGYTGLSAALHLAARGVSVCLLEARRVGWGASGRNGGQIHSGQRRDQLFYEQLVGLDDARKFWQMGEESKALIADLIARHKIDCDLRPGLLHGDHKPHFVAESQAYVAHLRNIYGYDKAETVSRDEIRAMVDTQDYHGGMIDHGAGHLHPLNFALGLADAARKAGADIYEQSAVVQIVEGSPAKLRTQSGTVTADYVLLACNGYFDGLMPEVESRVMPLNNFILATEPLGSGAAKLIRDNVAVSDSRFVINYYRLSSDGRLLFGGGETYSTRYPADIKGFVRKHMLKIFPQLAGTRIDYGWGGTLGITLRRVPYFRKLGNNVLVAAGYCGQGVTMATLGGQIAADAIAGTLDRFDLLAKLPTPPFPGGKLLRWPSLVAGMSWYALRDRL